MPALLDHLWQSVLVFALITGLARLTRSNSGQVRLWMWRVAAAKFLGPFAALVWLGQAAGFPVNHSSDSPPAWLVQLAHVLGPWLSPGERLSGPWRLLALLILFAVTLGALLAAWGGIGREHACARAEQIRADANPDDRPPGVSFLVAALITACTLIVLIAPLAAGALDSQRRHLELLATNTKQLSDARIVFTPAKPGMGQRYRLEVDANGVTIRNATLREIMGLSFGVTRYSVYGVHFQRPGEPDWLIDDRHDVRITGPIVEPESFDTYALHEPMTRAIALQFGIELHLNGVCQPPCGRWGSFVLPASARLPGEDVAGSGPAPLTN